ncbi:IS3 family transposase [Defluviitalea raffinosedens]|uniref:IS3 family transposase n=1 Tax=Defluviitalea raffinosedens TaxID=1450156 RepID=UPI00195DB07C
MIEEKLKAFDISQSLIHKGFPYNNAVAETTFKIIKNEFDCNQTFSNLHELKYKLADYVN